MYSGAYVLLRFDTTVRTTEPSFFCFDGTTLANKVGLMSWGDNTIMDVLIYATRSYNIQNDGVEYTYLPVD